MREKKLLFVYKSRTLVALSRYIFLLIMKFSFLCSQSSSYVVQGFY